MLHRARHGAAQGHRSRAAYSSASAATRWGKGSAPRSPPLSARKLGVPAANVVAVIGDTRASPQHMTAGSWGTASAIPAAIEAADAMLKALAELSPGGLAGRTPAEILKAAGRASLEVEVRTKAPGQPDAIYGRIAAGQLSFAGPVYPDYVTFSYIAHFVEVRVEPTTRRVRIPRVVSVVDCGRVISPRTAASQVRGGVVWGIGAALREASEVDPRYGGFLNADLAEYVVPVNADIGSHRGGVHRQARLQVQQRRRQGAGGSLDGRRRAGHRQCGLSRHRPSPAQAADPDRTFALTVAAPLRACTAVALHRWRESSVPKALPPASAAITLISSGPETRTTTSKGPRIVLAASRNCGIIISILRVLLQTSASLDDAFSSLREYAPSPTRTSRQG